MLFFHCLWIKGKTTNKSKLSKWNVKKKYKGWEKSDEMKEYCCHSPLKEKPSTLAGLSCLEIGKNFQAWKTTLRDRITIVNKNIPIRCRTHARTATHTDNCINTSTGRNSDTHKQTDTSITNTCAHLHMQS